MSAKGTYVYCLIAAARRPALRRPPKGLPGTGPVRLLDAGRGRWLAVADAPLDRYGEAAINDRLASVDWVSRAAVAHETVVESFLAAAALLPMKLFTIFTSDERALADIKRRGPQIDAALKRVANRDEWGVRVMLDRARALGGAVAGRGGSTRASGAGYLTRKKAQRDAAVELAHRAREVGAELYDVLAGESARASRRSAVDLAPDGGPLLLDAAFLVPSARGRRFRAIVERRARALQPHGYVVTLSGPWPPYSFMQD